MANKKFGNSFETLRRFGERYRADAAVRARVGSGDYSDLELELPEGCEVRVMEQSPDTYYFALPPEPHVPLADKVLERVVGGVGSPRWMDAGGGCTGCATAADIPCHGTSEAVLRNL